MKKMKKNKYLSLPFLILNENSFVQFHDVVTTSLQHSLETLTLFVAEGCLGHLIQ